jgi:diphosphomevalonate decarboxylase
VDLVLIAGSDEKKVSSTEAHRLVKESPRWNGRVRRAANRHSKILSALEAGRFEELARESWEEFQDMHDLFHTANPPFSYWNDSTRKILDTLIRLPMDRVCLTMDAGPNVHCLVRESEAPVWRARLENIFPGLTILEDRAGHGAEILEV